MPRIEQITGVLKAVDTDERILTIAVIGGRRNQDYGYDPETVKQTESDFMDIISAGTTIICAASDDVVQRLRLYNPESN